MVGGLEVKSHDSHMIVSFYQLSTTYANNFITLTQLEALFAHMNVRGLPIHVCSGSLPGHQLHPVSVCVCVCSSQNQYAVQPMELVRVVKRCLFIEAELVDKQEQLSVSGHTSSCPAFLAHSTHCPPLLQAPSPLAHQPPSNYSQIQQCIQHIIGKTEVRPSL